MGKIGVIGAGIYGTALALTAARADNKVLCWARNRDIIASINNEHINQKYLPNTVLPSEIMASESLANVFEFSDVILLTTSAQSTREVIKKTKTYMKSNTILVLCAKGIEQESGKILSEIAQDEIPDTEIAILTGPGFAQDIAKKKFVSVTIAAKKTETAAKLTNLLGTPYYRPYMTTDIISPQIGGSVKNVIAIASGIVEGAALGEGARAALITRGIAEMSRFSKALGGEIQTIMGMCGLGDLVMSAGCAQSRNFSFGRQIGIYGSADKPLKENTQTVEGIYTARAVVKRARELNVEMPICETVNRILYEGVSLQEAIKELLARPYKSEGY